MKIIYIHKEEVHKRPPVLSAITHILALGYDVELITCGCNKAVKEKLENADVKIHIVPYCRATKKAGKVLEYINFRKDTYKVLEQIYDSDSILWIEAGATVMALGVGIKKYRYILQIQELYELEKRMLSAISKVIKGADAVFVPEYNRAVLYQVWFKLQNRPYVMPNIPSFFASSEEIDQYKKKYKDYLAQIEGKRIIIYQGYIGIERPLHNYVRAIKELGNKFQLVLVGKDCGALQQYREILPNLIHIDYLPSPEYLFFTQNAHIGIVTYDPLCLNNAYCAPNKVFEYAIYKLPMLGNDIPGLKYLIEPYEVGKIVDDSDVQDIRRAIEEIDKDYQRYSDNTSRLFKVYNNKNLIGKILKGIENA